MREMTEPSLLEQLRRFVRSYPTLFGIVIGVVLVGGIIVTAEWFPRVGDAWQRNNADVRSVFFTIGFFAIWISRVWRWRRRNARVFWISISVFFFLHTLGVLLYSMWVHPLLLTQWILLMAIESFVLVFGLDWLMKRAGGEKNR